MGAGGGGGGAEASAEGGESWARGEAAVASRTSWRLCFWKSHLERTASRARGVKSSWRRPTDAPHSCRQRRRAAAR